MSISRFGQCVVIALSLFVICLPLRALDAGVAQVDLTPPLEMKATLGGYGERLNKPATGIHDRIWAKALVLRSGSTKCVIVTADVLGFPPPVKPAVLAELAGGWKPEQVLLLPSHSHTSLDLSALNPNNDLGNVRIGLFHPELYQRTIRALASVIREADRALVPVKLQTESVELAGWNRNRRGNSVTDRQLTVTRIDQESGKPLAALVNWTAHPTFMSEDDMMFSGDWPGHLQRTMEALIGKSVTVMYYNGAEGDQAPVARPAGGSRWERAERYGRELAIEAWRVWERIQTKPTDVLQTHLESIDLPARKPHPDFLRTGGTEYGLTEESVQVLLKKLAPERTHSLSVQVGDLLIVGVPGEMAADLGVELKTRVGKATKARHITIGGIADEWVSYILSPTEYTKGGYEASVSFYGAGLAEAIMEGAARGVKALR